jgi:ComF family protein
MSLLSLLLPCRCGACAVPGSGLCDLCRAALIRLAPPWCDRCGAPGAWPVNRCAECSGRRLGFASARAAIVYDDRARVFVQTWKERGRRDLSAIAADLVVGAVSRPVVDALVPVPGDDERGLRRGHAPAVGLAEALGARWDAPVLSALVRTRPASRQRGLALAERRRNVAGAFAVRDQSPRRVCLVDDVYTTGATAAVCATALRRSGAERVDVVTVARAVR